MNKIYIALIVSCLSFSTLAQIKSKDYMGKSSSVSEKGVGDSSPEEKPTVRVFVNSDSNNSSASEFWEKFPLYKGSSDKNPSAFPEPFEGDDFYGNSQKRQRPSRENRGGFSQKIRGAFDRFSGQDDSDITSEESNSKNPVVHGLDLSSNLEYQKFDDLDEYFVFDHDNRKIKYAKIKSGWAQFNGDNHSYLEFASTNNTSAKFDKEEFKGVLLKFAKSNFDYLTVPKADEFEFTFKEALDPSLSTLIVADYCASHSSGQAVFARLWLAETGEIIKFMLLATTQCS